MEWVVHQLFLLGTLISLTPMALICLFLRSLVGRQLGITAHSMGLVFCAVPIAGIIIKPLLGGVADK